MRSRYYTKKQVLAMFSDYWKEAIIYSQNLRGDYIAKREMFNNFVDFLNKEGRVSDKQAFNWSNPF